MNSKEWEEIWGTMDDDSLFFAAVVRMIECTNGCVQYAFRDNDPRALSVEKTRETMKFSMGVMKTKTVPHLGKVPVGLSPVMDRMRSLYVKGFKEQDEAAFEEFMVASVANANAIGVERMTRAEDFVREFFSDVLDPEFITYGRMYLDGLMVDG